jgi:hypothetical protein
MSDNPYRPVNYFLTESTAALTVESTTLVAESATAVIVESAALTVESTAVVAAFFRESAVLSVPSPELQAVKKATTANAKITFFIGVCLNFKNYNFQFIPVLKKGNPTLYNFFFVALGYK